MGQYGDQISKVHDSEQSAYEKYVELAAQIRDPNGDSDDLP